MIARSAHGLRTPTLSSGGVQWVRHRWQRTCVTGSPATGSSLGAWANVEPALPTAVGNGLSTRYTPESELLREGTSCEGSGHTYHGRAQHFTPTHHRRRLARGLSECERPRPVLWWHLLGCFDGRWKNDRSLIFPSTSRSRMSLPPQTCHDQCLLPSLWSSIDRPLCVQQLFG